MGMDRRHVTEVEGTVRAFAESKNQLLQEPKLLHGEAGHGEALAAAQVHKAILDGLNKLFLDTYYVNLLTNDCQTVGTNCEEKFMDQMFGVYDEVLAEYLANAVHPDDREMVGRMASRAYAGRQLTQDISSYSFIYRRLCAGKYLWYRMNLILSSVAEDGSVEYVVLAFMDVDEETRREAAYQKRLEQTNRDLTASLEQESRYKEALKQAYDTAMQANKAKSDFLSNMSHDIRTPMNGIIGMTAIALENIADTEKAKECLVKIEMASAYLLQLINDVLDMSKIEAGNVMLAQEETALADIVESIVVLLQPQIREKRHSFTVRVKQVRHQNIVTDELRLSQILINLVGNAVKYTRECGEILLAVSEKGEEDGRVWLEFVIADNGIGMSEDFLPKLFEAFTQEDAGARTQARGSGLGMAIVHNLVAMMNGVIHVDSEQGKGTVFTVSLPFVPAKREGQETESWEIHIDGESDSWETGERILKRLNYGDSDSLAGCRFLLVEDNELNMEIMLEILQEKEALVETAENGKAAVERFLASEPGFFDLILMDIKMPEMNGYEAVEQIRASGREDAQTVPIIALSADAFMEDVQKSLAVGMNSHVAKPVDFSILNREIRKYVKQAKRDKGRG